MNEPMQLPPKRPFSFWLDAQRQNRKHPETFEVPANEDLLALRPGDLVKVAGVGDSPEHGGCVERLWTRVVQVTERDYVRQITAILQNTPAVLTGLGFGDKVTYELRHVMSLDPHSGAAVAAADHSTSA